MKTILLSRYVIILVCLWIIGCGGSLETTSGNSVETGNPSVSGVVESATGEKIEGAVAYLVPKNFNPIAKNNQTKLLQTYSNSKGEFYLEIEEGDEYNLEIRYKKNGIHVQNISEDRDNIKSTYVLKPYGNVNVKLPKQYEQVYFQGSTVYQKKAKNDTLTSIVDIPSGTYSTIGFWSESENVVIKKSVYVKSGVQIELDLSKLYEFQNKICVDVQDSLRTFNVYQFPYVVKLSALQYNFSQFKRQGNSIFFETLGGRLIPHRIENWNYDETEKFIWIQLDTVYKDDVEKCVVMKWGGDVQVYTVDNPFGKNYQSVLHFNEFTRSGGVIDDNVDQTIIPTYGGEQKDVEIKGKIAQGMNLESVYSQYPDTISAPQQFTISLWFKTNQGFGEMVGFTHGPVVISSNEQDRHVWIDEAGIVYFGVFPIIKGIGVRKIISSKSGFNNNEWHHVVATLSGKGQRLWIDGVLQSEDVSTTSSIHYMGNWRLGYQNSNHWEYKPSNLYFSGVIDEVQISHYEWSEDWIRLSYQNQLNP